MNELISYLKSIDTPTLSNAIELLNVRPRSENFAPLTIRCLYPELGPMVGYAVTAQMETVTQMEPGDVEQTMAFYRAVAESPKPAVVVLQEVGGAPEHSAHAGEIVATLLQSFGAIGLVTDCGVRDFEEVRRLGFHYFAAGTVASHAYCRYVRVGTPVLVRGMMVRPGDLIHGDVNGVLEVPAQGRDQLPAMVDRVRRHESILMDEVRAGGVTLDRLKQLLTGNME